MTEFTHLTTQQLPEDQRPYEKCLLYGPERLTDAELLAAVLQTGTVGMNATELAARILQSGTADHEGPAGLSALYRMTVKDLTEIPGIGRAKAARIRCIGELSRRMAASSVRRTRKFLSPSDIADFYMERLRHQEQEYVFCLMLDTKNAFLGEVMISKGTVNASFLSPREIFLSALSYKAVSIALVHNHPSGDPTPSDEDIQATGRISEAGKILGIPLLDHIVIGDLQYESIMEYKMTGRKALH